MPKEIYYFLCIEEGSQEIAQIQEALGMGLLRHSRRLGH